MFFWKLDCEILPAPKVFEGFRHARATTRACALRPTFCKGFVKQCYVRTKHVPAYRFFLEGNLRGSDTGPLGIEQIQISDGHVVRIIHDLHTRKGDR